MIQNRVPFYIEHSSQHEVIGTKLILTKPHQKQNLHLDMLQIIKVT